MKPVQALSQHFHQTNCNKKTHHNFYCSIPLLQCFDSDHDSFDDSESDHQSCDSDDESFDENPCFASLWGSTRKTLKSPTEQKPLQLLWISISKNSSQSFWREDIHLNQRETFTRLEVRLRGRAQIGFWGFVKKSLRKWMRNFYVLAFGFSVKYI